MTGLPASGYKSKSLVVDLVLGVTDGLDSALWCYAFASVIFTGVLSVFLPVGALTMLLGWAVLSIFVAVTTRASLHMANIDEQAVVIIATIGVLMVAEMGSDAAGSRGLATLLAVTVISSLGVAASCWLVGHFNISRLLELLPFPVVCGFMAGIGWLLLDAGVIVTADVSISSALPSDLEEGNRLLRLVLAVLSGLGLMWAVNRIEKSWSMPVASMLIVVGFYAVVGGMGLSMSDLLAQGWLFEVQENEGGALGMILALSPSDIDFRFIGGVVPQILTIIFLVLLSSSMSLAALKTASKTELNTAEEFKHLGGGNMLCSLVGSPPGYTDVVASSLYEEFGASSRWMPLASSAVCLLIATMGGWIIAYIPKLLVAATVFLFAFQTLYEWMYLNVRSFSFSDYAIVCIILGTVIFAGFMQGIGVGIILTVLLFVLRYSQISAIQGQHSLLEHRSTVERCSASKRALDSSGGDVIVFTLRGFLFFGTANDILDTISGNSRFRSGEIKAILMDMTRVTGMDVSSLNTFVQIRKICDPAGVLLLHAGMSGDLKEMIGEHDAFSEATGQKLIFDQMDFAIEFLENLLLSDRESVPGMLNIRDFLADIIGDAEKVQILLQAMQQVKCGKDEILFSEGELDTALYIVESGSLSAYIRVNEDADRRVKKFSSGSLIGELSAYLPNKKRTATIIAEEDSVLYRLSSKNLARLDHDDLKLTICIHELVAKTLAQRITFMNRRLVIENM